jgi:Leucine-rich repeat (LRR) protein
MDFPPEKLIEVFGKLLANHSFCYFCINTYFDEISNDIEVWKNKTKKIFRNVIKNDYYNLNSSKNKENLYKKYTKYIYKNQINNTDCLYKLYVYYLTQNINNENLFITAVDNGYCINKKTIMKPKNQQKYTQIGHFKIPLCVKSLSLRSLYHISLTQNLNNLSQIRSLSLVSCNLQKIPILQLPHLKLLNLSNNNISVIENMESLPNLQCLALGYNKISVIEHLENNTQLELLYLHHNNITKISGIDNLKNLQRLILAHNLITEYEWMYDFPNFIYLNISYNKIIKLKETNLSYILVNIEHNPITSGVVGTMLDWIKMVENDTIKETTNE